eukprot:TRINITY_DN4974_c0_g1_i1.p1 TRINITY_DN4974_c0_g1~~TRINITY_DN4974_c0_g1_i1.p1  ORF type:complete len:729 (+),score=157.35 TRINITY_DN4974_c0_g1_i1:99-2285(+)
MANISNVISLTPLYGAGPDEPCCYLLRLENFTILLDCGWDEQFDEETLQPLKKLISDVDLVLLSHPDIYHLGALPYAIGKLGLSVPIYATLPVWKMGEMFLYDAFQSRSKFGFSAFSLDDVDAAFEKITKLKYSQEVALTEKGEGITITPFTAGHMIGSAIWKITKETEEILYVSEYNHRSERHLNGGVLEVFQRPSLLICDAQYLSNEPLTRKLRDSALFESITKCVQGGGNVMLPVDSAGRVLELLLCLHQQWEYQSLHKKASLILLSNVAFYTVDFARSQIEWMSEACMKQFDQSRDNPFSFKLLHVCHKREELDKYPKPWVVLASDQSLETSFARDLFIEMSSDPKNLLLLTCRTSAKTLASKLLHLPKNRQISFTRQKSVLLRGTELQSFLAQQRIQQEQERLEKKTALESDSDADDDADDEGIIRSHIQLMPSHPMFPLIEKKPSTLDVYGEVLKHDEFKKDTPNVVQKDDDMAMEDQHSSSSSSMSSSSSASSSSSSSSSSSLSSQEQVLPTKTIIEDITMQVKLQVMFIDFEGRSDGRSIKTILSRVAPRKLILVRGSDSAKDELSRYCTSKNVCKEVFVPKNNQNVDVTSETSIYRINLTEQLLASLDFVKIGDYDIAYADAEMKVDYLHSSIPVLQQISQQEVKGHAAVFLGDLKFSELKRILNKAGMQAEFYGGILVCAGGAVNIRKISPTQISIQGSLCEDYFKIRSLLYGKYWAI